MRVKIERELLVRLHADLLSLAGSEVISPLQKAYIDTIVFALAVVTTAGYDAAEYDLLAS